MSFTERARAGTVYLIVVLLVGLGCDQAKTALMPSVPKSTHSIETSNLIWEEETSAGIIRLRAKHAHWDQVSGFLLFQPGLYWGALEIRAKRGLLDDKLHLLRGDEVELRSGSIWVKGDRLQLDLGSGTLTLWNPEAHLGQP